MSGEARHPQLGRVTIVFSVEEADDAFRSAPYRLLQACPPTLVICVDLPRALLVTSTQEAAQFYADGG